MLQAMYNGVSAIFATQQDMDVIGNNISNVNTTAYKTSDVTFADQLSQTLQGASSATNAIGGTNPLQTGTGVKIASIAPLMSQGSLLSTSSPTDLAIQGNGFFQVQTPQGATQYTRNGAFQTDNQGQIVTSTGMPVLSDSGQAITLPNEATDVTISGDGFITAQVGTGSSRAQLGKIAVVKFDNDQQVTSIGGGLLTSTQTPTPVTSNPIVQGAIEESNVKPVSEITNLITIQRAYEQASNLLSQESGRRSAAIDKLSQTS